MIEPKFCFVFLGRNKRYPIESIHYDTKQVTVIEKPNVSLTVSFDDVRFLTDTMTSTEWEVFAKRIGTDEFIKVDEEDIPMITDLACKSCDLCGTCEDVGNPEYALCDSYKVILRLYELAKLRIYNK